MVESRMIRKNHCLIEHILHLEIYHFFEIFRTWFSKTSHSHEIIEFFFGFPKSRLF